MEITEIKSRLPIMRLLDHFGLKPDRNNRVNCPLHADKTPSLQIYPDTNTAYCFSAACPTHGHSMDTIALAEQVGHQTKHEAILLCKELAALTSQPIIGHKTAKAKSKAIDYKMIFSMMQLQLKTNEAAKKYAAHRGINILASELGYNPYQSDFPHLNNCLIFPLRDQQNKIVSLYGRSIINAENSRHYYMSDRVGLYPNYPGENTRRLLLTESIIDALTLLQIATLKEVTILACYGTNGLGKEHIKAITELSNLEEIIFFFDGDQAGDQAVKTYSEELHKLMPTVLISQVNTIEGEDINSLLITYDESCILTLLDERKQLFLSIEKQTEKQAEIQAKKQEELQAEKPTNIQETNVYKLNVSNPELIQYSTNELLITLMGGIEIHTLDRMRTTLLIRRNPHINASYVMRKSIDLYQDDLVEKFVRRTAEKLEMSSSIIGQSLAEMIEQLETYRTAMIEGSRILKKEKKQLTQSQIIRAENNLKRSNLTAWLLEQYSQAGIIGERTNAVIVHYAMTSRILDEPISVMCLSPSGTGKSYLFKMVAKCMPEGEVESTTQLSENALYYSGTDLKHKCMIIEDMDGAMTAEYGMRELISNLYLTKRVSVRDPKTGKTTTVVYVTEGPTGFFGSTTKESLYEDNSNRCILIYLDESREQDERVMSYQRKLKARLIDQQSEQEIREQLQEMQMLLKKEKVCNPYAHLIDLPDTVFKPRRTNNLLHNFIEAITLYHQYQCEKKDGYLITHPDYIEWTFKLLRDTLFRKSDEISGALRSFMDKLLVWSQENKLKSFYTQDVRLAMRLNPRTAQRYFAELVRYGYVKIVTYCKQKKGNEYEFTGLGGAAHIKQMIDDHISQVMDKVWKEYNDLNRKKNES